MNKQPVEIEGKWMVADLSALERTLKQFGAVLIQPRVFENNLRFDTPDGSLTQTYQVLRLRQDTHARMTYKGPNNLSSPVNQRTEIEFNVSDFNAALALLQALGYQIVRRYEKYRTTYAWQTCHIMLDEMPYGLFLEIEGESIDSIHQAAEALDLRWEAQTHLSYLLLFEQYCQVSGQSLPHLTFDAFNHLEITPDQLGLSYADRNG
ncbi:MAG: class IV adenylate cyclase [Anaerolineaceae bacterium]|nr:class IV adenylate cyclase [Anaerolineaceae bacterium]